MALPLNQKIENNDPYVKDNKGINTAYPALFQSDVTINGTLTASGQSMEGAQIVTATSVNALAVGQAGTTNPTLNIDTSTASAATGINIKSAAAGSGVAESVISSGTNENLTIDAKGSGTVTINGTATGIVALPSGSTAGGVVIATGSVLTNPITATSATAFGVGQNGATNPAFNIDTSTASSATGINIKSAAAGGGAAISVLSSSASEGLSLNAKGTGSISLGNSSTGTILLFHTTQLQGGQFLTAASGSGGLDVSNGTGNFKTSTGPSVFLGSTNVYSNAVNFGHTPVAINSTGTATAAQVASGYITSTSAAATTITLPTGTLLGTQLVATQGTTFDLFIDNTAGANTVTIAVAVNGILSAAGVANAASQGLLTVPSGVTGQACFRLMFSSATAYTFTRVA